MSHVRTAAYNDIGKPCFGSWLNHKPSHLQVGFTLIELLVIVSIIAVLMAILMPALNKARGAAKAVHCIANLRGIGQASFVYSADNDNRIPIVDSSVSPRNIWDSAIAPYMGLARNSGGNLPFTKLLRCPSDWRTADPNSERARSYSPGRINPAIDVNLGLVWAQGVTTIPGPRWPEVQNPSSCIYLCENQTYPTPLLPPTFNNGSNVQYRPENSALDTWTYPAPAAMQFGPNVYAHGSTMSFLLADGHAVQGRPQEVSRKQGAPLTWWRN